MLPGTAERVSEGRVKALNVHAGLRFSPMFGACVLLPLLPLLVLFTEWKVSISLLVQQLPEQALWPSARGTGWWFCHPALLTTCEEAGDHVAALTPQRESHSGCSSEPQRACAGRTGQRAAHGPTPEASAWRMALGRLFTARCLSFLGCGMEAVVACTLGCGGEVKMPCPIDPAQCPPRGDSLLCS